MFEFMKKKQKKVSEMLGAPMEGEAVLSSAVNDPTFGEELIGKGMAIKPTQGKVFAPVDGTVSMVFETKHALSIISEQGAEILIHVGLETVSLKGRYFTAHVQSDTKVKKGDLLLEFDMDAIKAEGFDLITPIIICNSDMYKEIERFTGKTVKPGDDVMELEK